jgi:hypothetical protein
VNGGRTETIKFSGKGLPLLRNNNEPLSKRNPKVYPDSVPSRQIFEVSNQTAVLSRDRLNFGHVPLGALLRQLVVVRNITDNTDVVFKWRVPSFWGAGGEFFLLGAIESCLLKI